MGVVCGAGSATLAQADAQSSSERSSDRSPTDQSPSKQSPANQGNPYAVIFGTVWDSDSRAVYGVHVLLRRSGEKKVRWEAYSDHHGEFAFRVPSGKMQYQLSADPKSLKALKFKDLENLKPVTVAVEYDERVDTGLHLTK